MRIAFAGTPQFAEHALAALIAARHTITLVLTQPDRAAGRGLHLAASPVKQLALRHGLEVLQPTTLRDPAAVERLRAAAPEVMVVAAYGLILPQQVLDLPPQGALNIHASLLPRWRGAAPIQRALLAGDRETGITIMRMDAGLDTGAMRAARSIPIGDTDDAGSLHDALASLGAAMIVEVLADPQRASAPGAAQPQQGATYASKIGRADTALDWLQPATQLERAVRAFRPAPGARARLEGAGVKIWRAALGKGTGAPGEVIDAGADGIRVACGRDALVLLELQRAGARRMSAAEFLRGNRIRAGARFARDD